MKHKVKIGMILELIDLFMYRLKKSVLLLSLFIHKDLASLETIFLLKSRISKLDDCFQGEKRCKDKSFQQSLEHVCVGIFVLGTELNKLQINILNCSQEKQKKPLRPLIQMDLHNGSI